MTYLREAILTHKVSNGIICQVCNHNCKLSLNKVGKCGVRKNIDEKVYVTSFNRQLAISIDPIEKKPLNHFLPKTMTYSLGCPGCNFKCQYCQNHMISQIDFNSKEIDYLERTPSDIIESTIKRNCSSISYTFTEPTVNIEFVLECMKKARLKGLKNIWVTNGYMTYQAFIHIASYLDAAVVSVKGNPYFYKQICQAELMPVLHTIRNMWRNNIHVEVNISIIPGYTDNSNMRGVLNYLATISKNIPIHLTKYHPSYNMLNVPIPTSKQLQLMKELAHLVGLRTIHIEGD